MTESDNSTDLLKDISPNLSAETELQLFLEMSREYFEKDRSTTLHAFQAIGYLTTYFWQLNEGKEPQEVSVPYWIIKALGIGWMNYREAFSEGRTTTLGEAYGLEGGGQGKSKKIRNLDLEIRDIRVAAKLASEISQGTSVTSAISDMANTLGVSEETIRRIWKRLGRKAKQVVKNSQQGQNLKKS